MKWVLKSGGAIIKISVRALTMLVCLFCNINLGIAFANTQNMQAFIGAYGTKFGGGSIENYRQTIVNLLNLGVDYTAIGQYKEAHCKLTTAINMAKAINNKQLEALGFEYLGQLYLEQKNKNLAKESFLKSYNLYNSLGKKNDAQRVLKYLDSL